MDSLSLVVIAHVLNQSKNHWLLFDALQCTITMCLKFKEEIINPSIPINLITDDFGIPFELSLFASNIKGKSIVFLILFFFFFFKP